MPQRFIANYSTGSGLENFFGDGSDGDFNSADNVTETVTAHSGIVIKQYTSYTLNAGHTHTTDNPCRGMIIYVTGDVSISGIFDMSKKAGYGVDAIQPLVITKKDSSDIDTVTKYLKLTTVLQGLKGGAGGNGGYGGGYLEGYRAGGGTGGAGRVNLGGYGGGGGGGGVIALFHLGTYTNNGTVQALGGTGGTGGTGKTADDFEYGEAGTDGSAGTIHTQQVA